MEWYRWNSSAAINSSRHCLSASSVSSPLRVLHHLVRQACLRGRRLHPRGLLHAVPLLHHGVLGGPLLLESLHLQQPSQMAPEFGRMASFASSATACAQVQWVCMARGTAFRRLS